jgi:hypothetical protein
MLKPFLVEFRLHGFVRNYAKWIRDCVQREANRLRMKELPERRFVGHITLFGKAESGNLENVLSEIEEVSQKYTLVPFRIGGLSKIRTNKELWLYLDVEPQRNSNNCGMKWLRD